MGYTIKVDWFKTSGKWYTSGEYRTSREGMLEVMQDFDDMLDKGIRPGLVNGKRGEFIAVVNCDGHPHGFPFMVNDCKPHSAAIPAANFDAVKFQQKLFEQQREMLINAFKGMDNSDSMLKHAENVARKCTVRLFEICSDEELQAMCKMIEMNDNPLIKSAQKKSLDVVMNFMMNFQEPR